MGVFYTLKDNYTIKDLVEIMALLRSEEGCPWDIKQTHQSIRGNFIEETYEAIEAIDTADTSLLQEELGDVLLQIVFHSQIEAEKDTFHFDDVCDGICKKLIYRHPHIFADTVVKDVEQVLNNWDALKRIEKSQDTTSSTLDGVSKALPSLVRSCKVQKRAAKVDFDDTDIHHAVSELKNQVEELLVAIENKDNENVMEEIGDLLFSAVNVSRILKKDPEEALYRATDKFINKFKVVESMAIQDGKRMTDYTLAELNQYWDKTKKNDD